MGSLILGILIAIGGVVAFAAPVAKAATRFKSIIASLAIVGGSVFNL
jgi:hypothetical protein